MPSLTSLEANSVINKQPDRPTEREFIGAALRYASDDYITFEPFYKAPLRNDYLRTIDEAIIINEWNAEGLGPQVEMEFADVESLALHLLAMYKKSKQVDDMNLLVV